MFLYKLYNGKDLRFASCLNIARFYNRTLFEWKGIVHEATYRKQTDNANIPSKYYTLDETILSVQHIKTETKTRCYATGMCRDFIADKKRGRWAYYLARELYYNKKWKSSIRLFEKYTTNYENVWIAEKSNAFCLMGECYAKIKEFDKAIKCFFTAYDIYPCLRTPFISLGYMYDNMAGEMNKPEEKEKQNQTFRKAYTFGKAALTIPKGLSSFEEPNSHYGYKPHEIIYRATTWLGSDYKKEGKIHYDLCVEFNPDAAWIKAHRHLFYSV